METLIPIAMRLLAEAIKLINSIKAQTGLTTEQLWAKADAQTKANKADIEEFLRSLPSEGEDPVPPAS